MKTILIVLGLLISNLAFAQAPSKAKASTNTVLRAKPQAELVASTSGVDEIVVKRSVRMLVADVQIWLRDNPDHGVHDPCLKGFHEQFDARIKLLAFAVSQLGMEVEAKKVLDCLREDPFFPNSVETNLLLILKEIAGLL